MSPVSSTLSDCKNTLYAESNHRIANNLTIVAGFLEQQSRNFERVMLGEASIRVAAAGELHRLLSANHEGTVELGAYLTKIVNHAVEALSQPGEVELELDVSDCTLGADLAFKIGMVVGELTVNAVKYAHPAHQIVTRLEIGCKAQDDGSTLIWVADDGIGLPEGFDPEADGGMGMRTIRAIAQQAGADLTFNDTGLGLTVCLSVPHPAAQDQQLQAVA
jgi:two-component sensor histidine kinase